jgi:hypothetical protein
MSQSKDPDLYDLYDLYDRYDLFDFLTNNIFNFKFFKICLVQKMQWPRKPAAKKY